MNELDSIVNNSKLPNQLKEYFTVSESIKGLITTDTIKEIEDLYIFLKSVYTFDSSEFSAYTITSLKKCKDLTTFYFYLKKVIDTNLELRSKDKVFNRDNIYIKNEVIDKVLKKNVIEFCNCIDKIYKKEKEINLNQTYRYLGKLEIISILKDNLDYQKILISGKKILEEYEKNSV